MNKNRVSFLNFHFFYDARKQTYEILHAKKITRSLLNKV